MHTYLIHKFWIFFVYNQQCNYILFQIKRIYPSYHITIYLALPAIVCFLSANKIGHVINNEGC